VRHAFPCLTLVLAAAACAGRLPPPLPRPLQDGPDHFLEIVYDAKGVETTAEPRGDGTCRSPLVDPRNGLHLTLERSSAGQGDYSVEAGRYGVRAGERVRIECATGRAVGIVRGE
jgi:hypothetical protein